MASEQNQSSSMPVAARLLEYRCRTIDAKPSATTLMREILSAIGIFIIVYVLFVILSPATVNDRNAKISAARADISAITYQLKAYELAHQQYPTPSPGIAALVNDKLLYQLPVDPWGHPYIYRSPGKNGAPFDLYSAGPNGQDENGAGDDISVH